MLFYIPMSTEYRRDIRLSLRSYVGTGTYFVTACTSQRRPVFTSAELCSVVVDFLRSVAAHTAFAVHAYCLMPDHVHVLAEGAEPDSRLQKFISRWKQITACKLRDGDGIGLWQKGFFVCILRKSSDVDAVARYVWMNPVRTRIVRRPEEYPYSGSFTVPWPVSTRSSKVAWVPPWKSKSESSRTEVRDQVAVDDSSIRGRVVDKV
jgi:putative transposase